jgi:hypothetical protein
MTRTRIWLLQARADVLAREVHPWEPPYDKTFAAVVRAVDERQARGLAQSVSGNEGHGIYRAFGLAEDEVAADVWLRPEYTDCAPLLERGQPGVILYDHREG